MKRSALILLGILAAAGSPAAGDWRVTRDGGRVETKGPWKVKGKLVVFTQTDGSLSSLRLTDVDLETSRKATSEATVQKEREKTAAPEPPKKKLAVLTDQTFRKPPAAASATEAPPQEGAQPVPSGTGGGPVTVSAWKQVDLPGSGGIEIQGTLHNTTDYLIVNPSVEVRLYDHAGDSIASAFGVLSTGAIPPKGTIDFRASLPGASAFAEVRFEPRGLPLDTRPADSQQPEEPQ